MEADIEEYRNALAEDLVASVLLPTQEKDRILQQISSCQDKEVLDEVGRILGQEQERVLLSLQEMLSRDIPLGGEVLGRVQGAYAMSVHTQEEDPKEEIIFPY